MLKAKLEALLFIQSKPVSLKRLSKMLGVSLAVAQEAVEELKTEKNVENSGVHVLEHENNVQLVTNSVFANFLKDLTKEEANGELTRPQLETLTIICYRGPITKPEIEQIRGVNCSLILRNLMIRGLITEEQNSRRLQPVYTAASKFIRHLGLTKVSALPEFERFNSDDRITKLLEESFEKDET